MAESGGFDWQTLSNTLNENHVPEIVLIAVGVLALLIVYTFLKDKESSAYKLLVLAGVIVGIVMVALLMTSSMKATTATLVVVSIGCFALIIRPFRDIHFAIILAVLGMVIAYILLGDVTQEPFNGLNNGWPRLVVAFVVGAIIYMLLSFLQALVLTTAKILNAWPVLAVVGVICIIEAICVWSGHQSIVLTIIDFFKGNSASSIIALLL